jgi:hypothetical protein
MFPVALLYARAAAARTKIAPSNNRGLGSRLKICHATKLIGIPPREITGDHPDFGKQEPILAREDVK